MKVSIYYFTGTGNSLAIARDLMDECKKQGEAEVELIPVIQFLHHDSVLVDSDAVGIVYPAWLHHVPPMIEEFIGKAVIRCNYLFAICTYSVSPYNSLFGLNALLQKKGKKLDSGFAVAMGGKYNLAKNLIFAEDIVNRRYLEEKEKVKEIARIVMGRSSVGIEGQDDESDAVVACRLAQMHHNDYKADQKFEANERCDRCGLCVSVCPRENITMEAGTIRWGDNCEYCLACLHWCPKVAIQNGELTQCSGRHHHPDISAQDIIRQKSGV